MIIQLYYRRFYIFNNRKGRIAIGKSFAFDTRLSYIIDMDQELKQILEAKNLDRGSKNQEISEKT